jgi:ParB/RepB/Spo0J family partition protein
MSDGRRACPLYLIPMPKRKHNSDLDYIQRVIDLRKVDRSPYQLRRHFDEDTLKELAVSIQREGLIEPIVVRPKKGRYELIAGELRFRAVRHYTDIKTIQAQIVKASELLARRISAAENLQREDLSAIETIEAVVEIVDAELIEDKEYASMGKNAADRVKTLLGKLKSMRRSIERRYTVSEESRHTSHKFVRRVENIFANLPKPLEWLSFFNHDVPLLIDFCEEVQEVSIQHRPWPHPTL